MHSFVFTLLFASMSFHSVSGHGLITKVIGANGASAVGFGVDISTPRDGTRRTPFQQDTSVIRDREILAGKVDVCGRTALGGNNDVATQLAAASAAGLPSMDASGIISMTLHQVNGDGAGPYACEVSADGTGQDFVTAKVSTNVPGRNSRSNVKATDFPLTTIAPAGTTCTGGPRGNACLVRCRNSAVAGPFGGCVAVTNAEGNSTVAVGSTSQASITSTQVPSAANAVKIHGGHVKLFRGRSAEPGSGTRRAIKSRVVTQGIGYWI